MELCVPDKHQLFFIGRKSRKITKYKTIQAKTCQHISFSKPFFSLHVSLLTYLKTSVVTPWAVSETLLSSGSQPWLSWNHQKSY
jgi:hypothetical protein